MSVYRWVYSEGCTGFVVIAAFGIGAVSSADIFPRASCPMKTKATSSSICNSPTRFSGTNAAASDRLRLSSPIRLASSTPPALLALACSASCGPATTRSICHSEALERPHKQGRAYQEIKARLNQQLSKLPEGPFSVLAAGNSWSRTSAVSVRVGRPCRAGRALPGQAIWTSSWRRPASVRRLRGQ